MANKGGLILCGVPLLLGIAGTIYVKTTFKDYDSFPVAFHISAKNSKHTIDSNDDFINLVLSTRSANDYFVGENLVEEPFSYSYYKNIDKNGKKTKMSSSMYFFENYLYFSLTCNSTDNIFSYVKSCKGFKIEFLVSKDEVIFRCPYFLTYELYQPGELDAHQDIERQKFDIDMTQHIISHPHTWFKVTSEISEPENGTVEELTTYYSQLEGQDFASGFFTNYNNLRSNILLLYSQCVWYGAINSYYGFKLGDFEGTEAELLNLVSTIEEGDAPKLKLKLNHPNSDVVYEYPLTSDSPRLYRNLSNTNDDDGRNVGEEDGFYYFSRTYNLYLKQNGQVHLLANLKDAVLKEYVSIKTSGYDAYPANMIADAFGEDSLMDFPCSYSLDNHNGSFSQEMYTGYQRRPYHQYDHNNYYKEYFTLDNYGSLSFTYPKKVEDFASSIKQFSREYVLAMMNKGAI